MIGVDSSVILYLFLPGEFALRAENWLKMDRECASPLMWRSEVRNVLAGHLRCKQLLFDGMRTIQREAETLLRGNEHEVDSQLVFKLVRESSRTAYDCEFVSVVIRLGTNLVTADTKVLKALFLHTIPFSAA